MDTRKIAINIVNHLNAEFHLELKTVDAAAMTDDVDIILSKALQQTDADELWDGYSEQIDSDIDSLSFYAGRNVITKESFEKLIKVLSGDNGA